MFFGYRVVNSFRSKRKIKIKGVPTDLYDPEKGHTGIDIDCPVGTPLSLPIKTTVKKETKSGELGLSLYLEDQWGNILVFSHLSEVFVKKGEEVQAHSIFAKSGNSGTATSGPHLHFEIIAKLPQAPYNHMTRSLFGFTGFNIDPVDYLEKIHKNETALDWCKTHLPEAEWSDCTEGEAERFRSLAKRIKQWQ